MATQFEIDNALMAGRAYFDTRASVNRFPVPDGWTEFFHVPNPAFSVTGGNGFEAVSFRRGSEIVISFSGTDFTDFSGDWTEANIPLAFGDLGTQLVDAARYYLEVKADNPGATISFTGHSLGGGLAALMAVFFDEQAVTFDQAPFAAAANDTVRAELEFWLNGYGYSDAQLTSLVPEFMSYTEGTRTANVTGYYVEGEVLQYRPDFLFDTIGTQTILSQHSVDLGLLGPKDLHSQTLLTAFLLNDDFRALTYKLPNLLQAMFDEGLYTESTGPGPNAQRNFLDTLVRHQIGVAADPVAGLPAIPANAMLDRFVVDLQQLIPDTSGTAAGVDMAKALTVFAMEYHYLKETGATQAFTLADYGLHFKYSDIGASSYKSLPKLAAAVDAFLAPEERTLLTGKLVKQDVWHIQSGMGGMTVNGGAGNDAMIGGANADDLWGGGGSDILIGGADNDTYLINPGDGFDTIVDSDGQGVINIAGIDAKGSATAGLGAADWQHPAGSDTWIDRKNGITYTQSIVSGETRLFVRKGGATVLIKDWSDGELGIVLGAGAAPIAAPPPSTSLALAGDLEALDHDAEAAGIQEKYDSLGNLIVGSEAEANRNDTVYDSSGNDLIQGWGGNDILNAWRGGDDWLEGNAGRDILSGGSGDDLLFGGNYVAVASALAENEYGGATSDGAYGDFLFGGTDNDTLVGSAQSDALMGGEGDDLILGGAGHDVIFADASYVAQDTLAPNGESPATSLNHGIYPGHVLAGGVYLSGEAGNDNEWRIAA